MCLCTSVWGYVCECVGGMCVCVCVCVFVCLCISVCVCVCVWGYIADSGVGKMGKQGGSNYGVFQVHLISP